MKVHKIGKKTATHYAGFGQYEEVPVPLCVKPKALYDGKRFYIHRLWKYVTCKHCLRLKQSKENPT
jgi:hypothetical protein